jgi:O-antigen biosynthesis protein
VASDAVLDEAAPERLIDPLEHPVLLSMPRRLTTASEWLAHVPFAMLLVDLLRPRTIVELGTFRGDSYCAFCQAVDELGLAARCTAVDTWKGDEQTGFYGDEVLAELRRYHDPLYGSFSRLLQATFDDALGEFEDGTVDLLHVDGYHAHEAVAHDVESWLPKVSARGVVLLHDTNVREPGYGVWKVWEELAQQYPSLELVHGHGLGMLVVGAEAPPDVHALASLSGGELMRARSLLSALGQRPVLVGGRARLQEAARLQLLAWSGERERADRLAATLSERDEEVRRLRGELRRVQGDLRDTERKLAALDTLAAHYRSTRIELGRAVVQHEDEAQRVYHSRSWRLLEPLRKLRRALTRFA